MTPPTDTPAFAEPRRPLLWATVVMAAALLVLAWPMVTGQWLVGAVSDQLGAGFAFRDWAARQWRATGHVPLWNPTLFGGLPFVAAQHGDIFYWTSFLRLLLPTDVVMNLGFAIHYLLAGLFTYGLLRALRASWLGAVVGGVAYQLSGLVASYPAPGHDGKLFVTALLPAALLALTWAVQRRRPEGFAALALVLGLSLLSPHYQMTYYLLIATGLFGLYLVFGAGEDAPAGRWRWWTVAAGGAAVLIGFGIAAIQILPFAEYLPYSPRATGYSSTGFAGSTSYAVPWSHVPEFVLGQFTGTTFQRTYWAANPLKLHSEYLGLPVVALAVLGIAGFRERRRLTLWLGGLGLLFLLIALGSATPFYRLWWTVMPYVKQTRAPGMAFYVVALVTALFAGFGVDRMLRGAGQRFGTIALAVGGAVALLGLAGAFGGLAQTMADALARGMDAQSADRVVSAARAGAGGIRLGTLVGGAALAGVGLLVRGWRAGRIPAPAVSALLIALVAGDLYNNARPFWTWQSPPREGLYRADEVTGFLERQPLPFRVLELTDLGVDVYGGAVLMDRGIPQVLGHHGFQPHAYNVLLGGRNEWRNLFLSRRIWDLDAAQYLLLPAGLDLGDQVPAFQDLAADFDTVLATVATSAGRNATLLRRREPLPWARFVAGGVQVEDDRAAQILADPRQPVITDRVVLLAPDTVHRPERLDTLPPPSATRVRVTDWRAGAMTLQLEPAAAAAGYVVVAENWYLGWTAVVDGAAAPVLRGNVAQMAVPVPAGAAQVGLRFTSPAMDRGMRVTMASLGLVVLGLLVPPLVRRRRA